MNDFWITLIGVLLLCIGPALADTETRKVETTVTLPATPEKVLQAFLDAGDLAAWWKVSRSLVEQDVGGVWSVTWDDWGPEKTQHAWVGIIDTLTPQKLVIGHLIMIEPDMPLMGPMQLEISARADGAGSILTISHQGYGYGDHWETMYDAVVLGWDHVLKELQGWLHAEY